MFLAATEAAADVLDAPKSPTTTVALALKLWATGESISQVVALPLGGWSTTGTTKFVHWAADGTVIWSDTLSGGSLTSSGGYGWGNSASGPYLPYSYGTCGAGSKFQDADGNPLGGTKAIPDAEEYKFGCYFVYYGGRPAPDGGIAIVRSFVNMNGMPGKFGDNALVWLTPDKGAGVLAYDIGGTQLGTTPMSGALDATVVDGKNWSALRWSTVNWCSAALDPFASCVQDLKIIGRKDELHLESTNVHFDAVKLAELHLAGWSDGSRLLVAQQAVTRYQPDPKKIWNGLIQHLSPQWKKHFADDRNIRAVLALPGGDALLSGAVGNAAWLARIDAAGAVVWQRTWTSPGGAAAVDALAMRGADAVVVAGRVGSKIWILDAKLTQFQP